MRTTWTESAAQARGANSWEQGAARFVLRGGGHTRVTTWPHSPQPRLRRSGRHAHAQDLHNRCTAMLFPERSFSGNRHYRDLLKSRKNISHFGTCYLSGDSQWAGVSHGEFTNGSDKNLCMHDANGILPHSRFQVVAARDGSKASSDKFGRSCPNCGGGTSNGEVSEF